MKKFGPNIIVEIWDMSLLSSPSKFYKELRYIIYRSLYIRYQTEPLGEFNKNQYFSVDESLFSHRNGKNLDIGNNQQY